MAIMHFYDLQNCPQDMRTGLSMACSTFTIIVSLALCLTCSSNTDLQRKLCAPCGFFLEQWLSESEKRSSHPSFSYR